MHRYQARSSSPFRYVNSSPEVMGRSDGDVARRFGGEELTINAPGTTVEALISRVELVRHAICKLDVHQNGRTLGSTSMSFGIATWTDAMARDGSTLIQTADACCPLPGQARGSKSSIGEPLGA